MKRLLVFIGLNILWTSLSLGQIQHPDEFFPHQRGEHFTPHHMLVDYFQHVAESSPLVRLVEYGQTNQDRPLIVAYVTSEENHRRLEEIRLNNLRLAGVEEGPGSIDEAKAIVWLSYSVHGNEPAGSEAAPQVLYDLVDPDNQRTKAWLENTVVILDPSINPDGYSRYTHWVRNVTMDENNPDVQDIEHQEPWPGGRVNHYLFDLNRDWAWQTQAESRHRMSLYNEWLPHVHADLHEMGHESPYFFAPAAKPFHEFITQWQRDFQLEIGKNHAKYFDKEGWLYFTKEVFDLFYPSYGDTYPTYNGAIGMTYEQGGGSRGGRGVKLNNDEMLTLKDRIDHHLTTSLSTIEVTSVHADKVVEQFKKFYDESSTNPPGNYKSYIIKKDKSGGRIASLAQLLSRQGIRYGTLSAARKVEGHVYSTNAMGNLDVAPGDLVVSAYQPKGMMTQILLDPAGTLEDSVTYDITAWSLPYAYGLEAIATEERIIPDASLPAMSMPIRPREGYAYLIPRSDMRSVRLISRILDSDISARVLPKAGKFEGTSYPAGTIVITRADNRSIDNQLVSKLLEIQEENPADIITLQTGFAEEGHDLGSNRVDLIKQPKVLTLAGEGIRANSFGQIKWYFDRVINYPLSVTNKEDFGRISLERYNTLILPDGRYGLSDGEVEKISSWVSAGGKLIVLGSANRIFMDREGFSLKRYATDDEEKAAKEANEQADLAARYHHYSDRERLSISDFVPGAIFQLNVDNTHPLGFGLGEHYFSLRTSSTTFPLVVDASNVIYHPSNDGNVLGFAGKKIKNRLKDSAAFVVAPKGRGSIIYMADNPLFRGFWYNGLYLFSNAVFLVN